MSTSLQNGSQHSTGSVDVDRRGDVVTVTLNRPDMGNTLSAEMFAAFGATLERESASDAKVLVLRAEGKEFCNGRDRAASDLAGMRAEATRLIDLKRALRASPLITIARVHGAAAGFGMGLAMLCDFAIVADDAPLSFPEMRMGLPPAAIMAYLTDYALPKAAFPLVLFGETFSAAHARDVGLISEAVPLSILDATVAALIARITPIPAASLRACKELFGTMLQGSFDSNCRLAADALAVASATLLKKL